MMSNRGLRSFVFVVIFLLRMTRQRLRCFTNLPAELQTEIFLRLPTRSLLVCKCVCKSFNYLIHKPSFVQAHLSRISSITTTPHISLLLNFGDHPDDYPYRLSKHFLLSLHNNTKQLLNYSSITPPIPMVEDGVEVSVVGSCNGLICFGIWFKNKIGKIYLLLWNPVIRQCRYLPRPQFTTFQNLFQFGFVSDTNDYVVLKLGSLPLLRVELYKMSIDAWTTIECTSSPAVDNLILSIYHEGTFFNGSFHWPAMKSNIVNYNIKDEKLGLIKAVNNERVLKELTRHEARAHKRFKVAVIDESLATIYWNHELRNILEIWVMKEYGIQNSWTPKLKIVEDVCRCVYPVGYWTDGLQLITEDMQAFQLYDLNTGAMMEIPKTDGNAMDLSGIFGFVETLVPVRSVTD